MAPRDPWLTRWLPLIGERAAGLPVFELGCGGKAIANARKRVPLATFHCQDIRAPFPVERTGVVIASLSLHDFPWPETEALADRIRQLLLPSGVLLCRLNSTNDQTLSLKERVIDRYDHPKWVWETILEKAD